MAIVTTDNKHYKAIADKVREIKGSNKETEPIFPSQMAQKVQEVYEKGKTDGGGDDSFAEVYQEGGNRIYYRYAFSGSAWTLDLLKKVIKYPIIFPQENTASTRYCMGMFYYLTNGKDDPLDMTEICEKIDFKNCKSANNLFQNANVINITVDLSSCESMSNTFMTSDNGSIDYINITVSEKTMFGSSASSLTAFNCTTLTEIRFLEGSVIGNSIKFTSTKLTTESTLSIFRTLKKYKPTDAGYLANTLTLHIYVWDRINIAYPNGTADISLPSATDEEPNRWKLYAQSIGWNV